MIRDTPTLEIITREKGHVIALARDFTMETRHQIGALFDDFFGAGYEIANVIPDGAYGVSFSGDDQGAFRYGVGFAVDPVPATRPEGTCVITLSGGDYAVLRAFGPVADLPTRFDWIFNTWLPKADVAQRDGAVFEVYPDDARNGAEGMAYEIWVPVAAKA